jgi:hypothetical protein
MPHRASKPYYSHDVIRPIISAHMPLTVRMNKFVGPDWIEDWGRCDLGTSRKIGSADVECRLSYGVASPTPRLPDFRMSEIGC